MKKIFAIALFCAVLAVPPTPAQEAKHHMLNFTQVLAGLDGKPFPITEAKDSPPATLGDVAVAALTGVLAEDARDDGAAKFKRGELAHRIYKAKSIELTVEEVALIKERIGKVYGPAVVFAAWPLLDPATK